MFSIPPIINEISFCERSDMGTEIRYNLEELPGVTDLSMAARSLTDMVDMLIVSVFQAAMRAAVS